MLLGNVALHVVQDWWMMTPIDGTPPHGLFWERHCGNSECPITSWRSLGLDRNCHLFLFLNEPLY